MSDRKRQKKNNSNEENKVKPITKFEEMSDQLILNIFNYINFYDLYKTFINLNKRLNKLIENHDKNFIDFNSIPIENFLSFCLNINEFIIKNHIYPFGIRVSNYFQSMSILNGDLFRMNLSKLKSLEILDLTFEPTSLILFNQQTKFYEKLKRLSLTCVYTGYQQFDDIQLLIKDLMSSKMKSLKYLKLEVQLHSCDCENDKHGDFDAGYIDLQFDYLSREENILSNQLTTLYFGWSQIRISFNTLTQYILPYLKKLENIIISCLYINQYDMKQSTRLTTTNLKTIKIWFPSEYNQSDDDQKEKCQFLRNFFLNSNLLQSTTIKTFYINNKNMLSTNF